MNKVTFFSIECYGIKDERSNYEIELSSIQSGFSESNIVGSKYRKLHLLIDENKSNFCDTPMVRINIC